MTEIENYSASNSSVKQIVAFAILVLLVGLSFSHPVVFGSTIDLTLYSAIPPVFWFALTYGLVLPFVTKWIRSPTVFKLWGGVVFSLFWSYLTVVEPELRFPDAYVHSRTTLLLAAQGVAPSVDRYMLWPNSFILQDITSQIIGLPLLATSRILAVVLVGLIGLLLMNIFSLFFEGQHRKALLCLFATFMFPNTLMLSTQHYSPQLVAYVVALLAVFVIYKETTKRTETSVVLILFLVTIIMSNPTTTIWIAPILIAVWLLKRTMRNSRTLLFSSFLVCLYLTFAAIWSIQPEGVNISGGLVASLWQKFLDLFTVGKYTLSEGLFRPSYQPFFSLVIRRFTFVFIGILLVPSILVLVRGAFDFATRKTRFLNRFDAFSIAVMLGSLVGTVFFWIGTGGGYGDRTWGILVPVLAVFFVNSITMIQRKVKTKILGMLLIVIALALIPLNYVATNYMESVNQTTFPEAAAIHFVSSQNFHHENVFSDNPYTLGLFSYALANQSNIIFWQTSQLLDPNTVTNDTYLTQASWEWSPYTKWTIFIHTDRTKLLMFSRYGVWIEDWKEFNDTRIDKFYDNGELKIYAAPHSGR